MNTSSFNPIPHDTPIFIVGGGELYPKDLDALRNMVGPIYAADSGADKVLAARLPLQGVIGDFDSISNDTRKTIPQAQQFPSSDQNSTDFEKSLGLLRAPIIHAVGFTGARLDHQLAVMNGLVKFPTQRVIVWGDHDVICICPPKLDLALPVGCRISLFPMGLVRGKSTGLRWPIGGLAFAPDGQIGTSNITERATQSLQFTAPMMLLCLPRNHLWHLAAALSSAPHWPVHAK